MSTLRISNIEAKADSSSPTVDEQLRFTNSDGDLMLYLDGRTAGITTVGINTTNQTIKFDANNNVMVTGIITATEFHGALAVGTSVTYGDNEKAYFGTGLDLSIYHTGSHSYIEESGTGSLYIDSNQLYLRNKDTSNVLLYTTSGGEVRIQHNGSDRIRTESSGVTVTGRVTATELDISGNVDVDGHTNLDNVSVAGVTTFSDNVNISSNKKLTLNNPGFEIYHDNSNAYLDNNVGHLYIRNDVDGDTNSNIYIQAKSGENGVSVGNDGSVVLFYDNNSKFQTTNTGTYTTGIGTFTDKVSVVGSQNSMLTSNQLIFDRAGTSYIDNSNDSGKLSFRIGSSYTVGLFIDSDGTVSIPSKLMHLGDTNTFMEFGADTISFDTAGSERVRIDAGGRLLVGGTGNTESDIRLYLHNSSAAGSQIQITGNGSGTGNNDGLRIGYNGSGGQMWLFENQYLRFATNNTERFQITSGGNALFGGVAVSQTNRQLVVGSNAEANLAIETHNTSASETANIRFYRSRGTAASPTTLVDNDVISQLLFYGHDGTDYAHAAAMIRVECDGTVAGNQMPGAMSFHTNSGTTSVTERLRILPNGRVHIRPSNTFYAMNSQSTDLVIGDGGGGRGLTFWTASAADNQTISFQTNESLSRAEGEISYGPTGTNTVADRNAMMFRTNSAERFRIDSSGRVSIASGAYGGGGTSPELYVRGTSGRQVKIHNTNAATCSLQLTNSTSGEGEDHGMQFALLGGGGGYFKHHVNNANVLDMYSQVSGSGKYIMKIYNDGKIGQQSNSDCLMLSTSQNGSGNQYFLRGSKNSTQPGGGNDVVWIYEDGDVYNNNNTYGQQSDIKLKENIVNASSQWDDIKNLKVRNFNFKESTGLDTHTQIGLVAQEAELVSPGLIKVVKDRKKTEEKNELGSISYKESLSETETTKYVKYSVLHMKAIKCLQEAQARIETLEQENIALRVRVTNLEDN